MNKMTDSSRLSSWPLITIIVSVHKNLFVYLAGVTNCHSIKTSINDIFEKGSLKKEKWLDNCGGNYVLTDNVLSRDKIKDTL